MNMRANTAVIELLKQIAMIVNVNVVTIPITIMKLSITGMLQSLSRLMVTERMPKRIGSETGTPINNDPKFPNIIPTPAHIQIAVSNGTIKVNINSA